MIFSFSSPSFLFFSFFLLSNPLFSFFFLFLLYSLKLSKLKAKSFAPFRKTTDRHGTTSRPQSIPDSPVVERERTVSQVGEVFSEESDVSNESQNESGDEASRPTPRKNSVSFLTTATNNTNNTNLGVPAPAGALQAGLTSGSPKIRNSPSPVRPPLSPLNTARMEEEDNNVQLKAIRRGRSQSLNGIDALIIEHSFGSPLTPLTNIAFQPSPHGSTTDLRSSKVPFAIDTQLADPQAKVLEGRKSKKSEKKSKPEDGSTLTRRKSSRSKDPSASPADEASPRRKRSSTKDDSLPSEGISEKKLRRRASTSGTKVLEKKEEEKAGRLSLSSTLPLNFKQHMLKDIVLEPAKLEVTSPSEPKKLERRKSKREKSDDALDQEKKTKRDKSRVKEESKTDQGETISRREKSKDKDPDSEKSKEKQARKEKRLSLALATPPDSPTELASKLERKKSRKSSKLALPIEAGNSTPEAIKSAPASSVEQTDFFDSALASLSLVTKRYSVSSIEFPTEKEKSKSGKLVRAKSEKRDKSSAPEAGKDPEKKA